MQRVLWFALFGLYSLSACKSGPRVTLCIVNAPEGKFDCVDPDENVSERVLTCADTGGGASIQGLDSVNNWACMSPADLGKVLQLCKEGKIK